MSDQTPVPGPALHPHPQGTSADYPRLLLLGLPSGQTQARGLPLLLSEQSAAVHSPPLVVSERVRLPVQLLARRHAPVSVAPSPARRKAQAHPPAATATPSRAKASTQVRPIPAPPTVTTAAFFAKTNFLHNSIST